MQILVHCLWSSWDLIVLCQWFELAPFGMVCPHVLVLISPLIRHLLATLFTVYEPGQFYFEPPDAIQQELWLLFLLQSQATWLWDSSGTDLLHDWLVRRVIVEDLYVLVPVCDVEVVIEDTLLQLSHYCHFCGSLHLVLILGRNFWSFCDGKRLTRLYWVIYGLKVAFVSLYGFLNRCLFLWHCGERILIFKFLWFFIIIIIFYFIWPFWATYYLKLCTNYFVTFWNLWHPRIRLLFGTLKAKSDHLSDLVFWEKFDQIGYFTFRSVC